MDWVTEARLELLVSNALYEATTTPSNTLSKIL